MCCCCARDIVVPLSLLAERDELIHKRDTLREELVRAKLALDAARRAKKLRSI